MLHIIPKSLSIHTQAILSKLKVAVKHNTARLVSNDECESISSNVNYMYYSFK